MAAGLRSGRPQIVSPIATDQFANAESVASRNCGLATPQLSKTSVDQLSKAIQTCVQDEKIISAARDMAQKIMREDGTRSAVEVIDKFIVDDVDTGKWKEK